MKIGIVATSDTNPYATALVARLCRQNDRPACIILAEEPSWHRFAAYVRVAGVRGTLKRIAGQYGFGGVPDRDARSYLREYATREKLADFDSPLTVLAAKHGASFVRIRSLHDEQAAECVRRNGLDLLINTAGVIFKSALLEAPRLGMLNAHMARLPEFRGMNVLEWSLWFGKEPGITVHFVTPGIDLGDILQFSELPVTPDDTVVRLRAKSYPLMVETMAQCVAALREGRETRTPQSRNVGRQYFVMHPKLLAITDRRLAAKLLQRKSQA